MIAFGIYAILLLAYLLVFIVMSFYWYRMVPSPKVDQNETGFSVVIPFRNEQYNLPELYNSLQRWYTHYPQALFEIIFVDDDSGDEGAVWLREHATHDNMKLLQNTSQPGKKGALQTGISAAAFPYIITIDADCIVSEQLLNQYDRCLQAHHSDMVIGPVRYIGHSLTTGLLNYELAGLVGLAGASSEAGNPVTANGANLCFRKEHFSSSGGYAQHAHIASGDDEFLVHQFNRLRATVRFLKSPDAMVDTQPPKDFKTFIQQRVRWAGKFRFSANKTNNTAPVILWVMYLLQTMLLFTAWREEVLALLFIKVLVEMAFMAPLLRFIRRPSLILWSVPIQLLYPLYILGVGVITLAKPSYIWKNRTVR